jgi:hypothetical protein
VINTKQAKHHAPVKHRTTMFVFLPMALPDALPIGVLKVNENNKTLKIILRFKIN